MKSKSLSLLATTIPSLPAISHNAVLQAEIPLLQKSKNPVTHDRDRQLTNVQPCDNCASHVPTYCVSLAPALPSRRSEATSRQRRNSCQRRFLPRVRSQPPPIRII
ncbi:hypothetical protein Zmor_016946 [Zophobas morio]|uniref:Uncharacterized protein n=1 Tax=Zophobas morio TaxID=2755281 RepID=A0AA38I858_9CUCU|nr:hypothetical protein Zmor_016946 [Zophobas morio]